MGNCQQARTQSYSEEEQPTRQNQRSEHEKCMLKVAHFTPATFPAEPEMNVCHRLIISSTWKAILQASELDSNGISTTGLTVFSNEFFARLDHRDSEGFFSEILTPYIEDSKSMVARRDNAVNRMMQFIANVPAEECRLKELGEMHSRLGVQPWQYSVFVQVILETIAARLGDGATNNVMTAWVNVLAIVLKSMLPAAISFTEASGEFYCNQSVYVSPKYCSAPVWKMDVKISSVDESSHGTLGLHSTTSSGLTASSVHDSATR